jgi:hypothetical protein
MEKYRSSGKMGLLGLPMLLLGLAVGIGVAVAGLAALDIYVYQTYEGTIDIRILFIPPLIASFIVGGAYSLGVRWGQVRNGTIVGLLALFSGVLVYGAVHYLSVYTRPEGDIRAIERLGMSAFRDANNNARPTESLQDQILFRYHTVRSFMELTADSVTISNSDGEVLQWVGWGFEVVLMTGFALWLGLGAAQKPFDETAGKWYDNGEYFASVPNAYRNDSFNAISSGSINELAKFITTQTPSAPRLDLYLLRSSHQDGDTLLETREITLSRNGETSSTKDRYIISASDLAILTAGSKAQATNDPLGLNSVR